MNREVKQYLRSFIITFITFNLIYIGCFNKAVMTLSCHEQTGYLKIQ